MTTRPASILVHMPFGSHLYGTATPTSDLDYKGVFLPTKREAFLGKIPRAVGGKTGGKAHGEKNAPGEVDEEFFSLHEFMRLALEGQTMALDMLHAGSNQWITVTDVWMELVKNRHRFETKNLQAFVGYARRQAAKYGVKGSRLATGKAVLEFLEKNWNLTVAKAFSDYPEILLYEHVEKTTDPHSPIQILGKQLTAGAVCEHYIPTFRHYVSAYGERAKLAEKNEGVDWKAVSHAVRASYEVAWILKKIEWSLPFDKAVADHLREIKQGLLPFAEVQEELEQQMAIVEELAIESDLPEKPDRRWAEEFLFTVMDARASSR